MQREWPLQKLFNSVKMADNNSGSQFGDQEMNNLINLLLSIRNRLMVDQLSKLPHGGEKTDCSFLRLQQNNTETAMNHSKINSIVIQRV